MTIRRPAIDSRVKKSLAAVFVLTLTGCASLSGDGGSGPVTRVVHERLNAQVHLIRGEEDHRAVEGRVKLLLGQALTPDAAVQVALLNNRGLQAALAELGAVEADAVQAGRLPNPGFSFARRRNGEVEWERGLHVDLLRILTLPAVHGIETRRLAQTQHLTAMTALALASDVRRAWILAVAAEENLHYARQVQEAAEAGAELARRMAAVGNFNRLQQAREQAFHADAALNLARATQAQLRARERLIRLLGLWGEPSAVRLPTRLPQLPVSPRDQPDIERLAVEQRLDLQAARQRVEHTARSLGLTQATRFVRVLEYGQQRSVTSDGHRERVWEIGFEIPLFDFGSARVAKAESIYLQAVHQAADAAISARSEVREAYGNYRSAWDIARHHRDEIVPLRKRISEENVLRYNGMLMGVFELLADARAQIAAVNASIDALRDYWLAQVDLDMALIGKPSLSPLPAAAAVAAEAGAAAH